MDAIHKPAQRHGFWEVWSYCYSWRWRPAVMDDFGNLIVINTSRAHHSLLSA